MKKLTFLFLWLVAGCTAAPTENFEEWKQRVEAEAAYKTAAIVAQMKADCDSALLFKAILIADSLKKSRSVLRNK